MSAALRNINNQSTAPLRGYGRPYGYGASFMSFLWSVVPSAQIALQNLLPKSALMLADVHASDLGILTYDKKITYRCPSTRRNESCPS